MKPNAQIELHICGNCVPVKNVKVEDWEDGSMVNSAHTCTPTRTHTYTELR